MDTPASTPTPRAQAIAAWRQVEDASAQLDRLITMGCVDVEQVARLLDKGASPKRAMHSWFGRIVSENDLRMAQALVPVFVELPDGDKNFALRHIAQKGSVDMMRLMLGCGKQPPAALFMALIEAVEADRIDMADILLDAGCPTCHPSPQEAGDSYHRLGARLKSVAMLELIHAHGWEPRTQDLFDSLAGVQIGKTEEGAPRVKIVERLLDMGVPAQSQHCLGHPWAILMRTPNKQLDFHDEQLCCARLLLGAGVDAVEHNISLPAMLVMLEAGVDPAYAAGLWQQSSREAVKGSDFFPPNDTQAFSMDKWMRKACDVLLAIDRNGLPLEQLKLAKKVDRVFGYALAAAGCRMEPQEMAGVPQTYLQWREQSILERHTAPAMAAPRAPRL